MADKTTTTALRISQLDAIELDNEVQNIFIAQIHNVFRYLKPHLLTRFEPEISAALRYIIWKGSINVLEATIGQQILDLRYKDAAATTHQWITPRQKALYALLTVGGKWLHDRSHDIQRLTENVPFSTQIWQVLSYCENGWKLASLLNFLVFLQRGHYQLLIERIIGIRAVFPRPQFVRQVGFDYVSRELLWHGFAEFLFFVLPLINFRRIQSFLMRTFLPRTPETLRGRHNYQACGVCGEWPTNPHQIGCTHAFCYYCIMSHTLADPGFVCPRCGHAVEGDDSIKPLYILIDWGR